jgi:hypothetical protein
MGAGDEVPESLIKWDIKLLLKPDDITADKLEQIDVIITELEPTT